MTVGALSIRFRVLINPTAAANAASAACVVIHVPVWDSVSSSKSLSALQRTADGDLYKLASLRSQFSVPSYCI